MSFYVINASDGLNEDVFRHARGMNYAVDDLIIAKSSHDDGQVCYGKIWNIIIFFLFFFFLLRVSFRDVFRNNPLRTPVRER